MGAHAVTLRLTLVALVGPMLVACGTGTQTPPTAPTPRLPTGALTINGMPSSFAVGQPVQLTASVTSPDGTKALTRGGTWTSSDATVATVSSAGVLTVLEFGSADVVANAVGQSASARLFAITGAVHESTPTQNVPVPGARVELQGVVDAGNSTTTDSSGRFTLEVGTAGLSLAVTRDGYDPASFAIAELPRDQHPDVALTPDDRPTTTRFAGRICNFELPPVGNSHLPCTKDPVQVYHWLPVHRPGPMEVTVGWVYRGDYSAEYLRLEVRCGGAMVLQELFRGYGGPAFPVGNPPVWMNPGVSAPVRATLSEPCVYEIRLFGYRPDHKGNFDKSTNYQVDVVHPK